MLLISWTVASVVSNTPSFCNLDRRALWHWHTRQARPGQTRKYNYTNKNVKWSQQYTLTGIICQFELCSQSQDSSIQTKEKPWKRFSYSAVLAVFSVLVLVWPGMVVWIIPVICLFLLSYSYLFWENHYTPLPIFWLPLYQHHASHVFLLS